MFDLKTHFPNSNKDMIRLEMALYCQMLKLHRKFILPKPFLPTDHHTFSCFIWEASSNFIQALLGVKWLKLIFILTPTSSLNISKYLFVFPPI